MYTNTMKYLDESLPSLAEATFSDFLAMCWAIECKVPDWTYTDYQAIRVALAEKDLDMAFLLYSDYYCKGIRYLNAQVVKEGEHARFIVLSASRFKRVDTCYYRVSRYLCDIIAFLKIVLKLFDRMPIRVI